MFTLPDSWELASLLGKLLLYIGAASIAGGCLGAWRYSSASRQFLAFNYSYILIGAVIGFQGTVLGFLIQVGLINDSGINGMFDLDMISILMETGLGDVTFFRLLAFFLAAACSLFLRKNLQRSDKVITSSLDQLMFILILVALLLLAFSHRVTGHVSVLSLTAQVAIVAHFIAFAAWIGCLLPFLQLSRSSDLDSLRYTLKRFGSDAIAILLILFLGGVLMLLELLSSPKDLLSTPYGVALLGKFILVFALLVVAAINKFVLVPALRGSTSVTKLRTSIRYELVLASMILIFTSYLSTIVGPAGH